MPRCYSADWVFFYAVCLVMEWKVKVKHCVDNTVLCVCVKNWPRNVCVCVCVVVKF